MALHISSKIHKKEQLKEVLRQIIARAHQVRQNMGATLHFFCQSGHYVICDSLIKRLQGRDVILDQIIQQLSCRENSLMKRVDQLFDNEALEKTLARTEVWEVVTAINRLSSDAEYQQIALRTALSYSSDKNIEAINSLASRGGHGFTGIGSDLRRVVTSENHPSYDLCRCPDCCTSNNYRQVMSTESGFAFTPKVSPISSRRLLAIAKKPQMARKRMGNRGKGRRTNLDQNYDNNSNVDHNNDSNDSSVVFIAEVTDEVNVDNVVIDVELEEGLEEVGAVQPVPKNTIDPIIIDEGNKTNNDSMEVQIAANQDDEVVILEDGEEVDVVKSDGDIGILSKMN